MVRRVKSLPTLRETRVQQAIVGGEVVWIRIDVDTGRAVSARGGGSTSDTTSAALAQLRLETTIDAVNRAVDTQARTRESAKERLRRAANHWTNEWFAVAYKPGLRAERLCQAARQQYAAQYDRAFVEAKKTRATPPDDLRHKITEHRARSWLNARQNDGAAADD